MDGNKSSRALDLIMNIKILEGNQGQCCVQQLQLRKNTRNRIMTVIGNARLYHFVCSSDIQLTRQICQEEYRVLGRGVFHIFQTICLEMAVRTASVV
jgi:hypothetical protein